ncbi:MAG: hypothetical protein HYY44_09320 [Deltaproteobacteria bacterium]|nr:hypothetical protein [Deltaproteobacteria bacterium]
MGDSKIVATTAAAATTRTIETGYTCMASVYDENGLEQCISNVELFQRRPAKDLWLEEGTIQCRRADTTVINSQSAWIVFQAYCSGHPLPWRSFAGLSSRVIVSPEKK